MPVSHTLRCIFVHVPKAAGNSILRALKAEDSAMELAGTGLWDLLNGHRDPALVAGHVRRAFRATTFVSFPQQHLPAAALRELLPPQSWNEYLAFAFVRNPWDLVVSTYAFQRARLAQAQARTIDPDVAAMLERCDGFSDFVRLYPALRSDMSEMLVDANGNRLVQFVGRYESLASDVARLSEQLGRQLTLTHENASTHDAYQRYYTPRTQAIVARHFERDIDSFGYTFDGT